jgi:maltose O-acetyltransferase
MVDESGAPTHRQRMLAGELYQASDPEVRAEYVRAQRLVRSVNATPIEDVAGRRPLLHELFGSLGADVGIMT